MWQALGVSDSDYQIGPQIPIVDLVDLSTKSKHRRTDLNES